jgi:hypothetical protein
MKNNLSRRDEIISEFGVALLSFLEAALCWGSFKHGIVENCQKKQLKDSV